MAIISGFKMGGYGTIKQYSVCPTSYDAPEEGQTGYEFAKQKLTNLILNKIVEINNLQTIDSHGRLVADAYHYSKYLAGYFSEYKI